MKRSRLLVLCVACGTFVCSQHRSCEGPNIVLTGKSCGSVQPLQLSCYLPADTIPTPVNASAAQRSADVFSWQEFLALNWPQRIRNVEYQSQVSRLLLPGRACGKHGKKNMKYSSKTVRSRQVGILRNRNRAAQTGS